MGFLRLIIFGFIGLSIIYLLVSLYSRSVRLEKLEEQWAEEHPNGNESDREVWLREGWRTIRRASVPS